MPASARLASPRHGFTLLETAIVLVIAGMIVGGLFIGRDLLRASQLQSIVSDESRYTKAVQLFKDKYHELPGDMPTATAYWGAQDCGTGTTEACHTAVFKANGGTVCSSVAYPYATCNGNGDGTLAPYTETDTSVTYAEIRRFWQQLYAAGFLETCCGNDAMFDDSPHARIAENAGWGIRGDLCATSDLNFFCANMRFHRHYFTFGAFNAMSIPLFPALTPSEALAMDMKIDDGLPDNGKLLVPTPGSVYGNQKNCTVPSSSPIAYNTAYTSPACGLLFDSGF